MKRPIPALFRSSLAILIVAVMLALTASKSRATVYVNRTNPRDPGSVVDVTLTSNTTWSSASGPYIVEGNVTVGSGVTLTVSVGTTVEVSASKGLYVNGKLSTAGSSFDANGSGYWKGIYLSSASGASSIINCVVDHAGSTAGIGTYHGTLRTCAIYVDDCNPSVTSTTVSSSASNGIELYSSNAAIQSCAFNSLVAGSYAVLNDTNDCFPVALDNTATGTGVHGIGVLDGDIHNGRWYDAGIPYVLRGDVTVYGLTIDPGATVKAEGSAIYVNNGLQAVGTSDSHITFTSIDRATTAGGEWIGIAFESTSAGSNMTYCDVYGAGSKTGFSNPAGGIKSAIYVDEANVSIQDCLISNSQTNDLEVESAAGDFGSGAWVGTIRDNTFEVRSGYYAVYCDDVNTFPNMSGNSATGSGGLGIALPGGTLSSGGTWHVGGDSFPYLLLGGITVPSQKTVTISAGATMLATGGSGFVVQGTLKAIGTAASPITFGSMNATPAAGDFGGFGILSGVGLTNLTYCNVSYAANNTVANLDPGTTIDNCTFSNGVGVSISVGTSDTTIHNNVFDVPAGSYAILYQSPNIFPDVAGNSLANFLSGGIEIPTGTVTANGTWMNPGTVPYHPTGDLTINSSVTVAPGCIFKMLSSGIYVNGTLTSIGTAASHITYTSSVLIFASPGNWEGITLNPSANSCQLGFCDVYFAGGASNSGIRASLRADTTNANFDHISIHNGYADGIRLKANNSAVAACDFHDINGSSYAVLCETPDTFPMVTADTADGTGQLGIGVAAGTISNLTGTWEKAGDDFPWIVTGNYTVASTAKLNINAGTLVELQNAGLYVNGGIVCQGNSGARVTFTSHAASPAPGDWKGIYLAPTVSFPTLQSADIFYAGGALGTYHSVARNAGLFVDGVSVSLDNLRVEHSLHDGVGIYASDANLRDSLVWKCAGIGFDAEGGATGGLLNSTIVENGTGVVSNASTPNLVNNVIAFNGIGVQKSGASSPTMSYNLVYGSTTSDYSGIADQTGLNLNSKADPLFAARNSGDFHLTADSPARNTGNNAAVPSGLVDLDGNARIVGTVDRGAYESGTVANFTLADVTSALRIAAGLASPTADDMARLNIDGGAASSNVIDLVDATALARKAGGTDRNP